MDVTQRGLRATSSAVAQSTSVPNTAGCQSSTSSVTQDLQGLHCAIINSIGLLELGNSHFDKALQHFLDAVTMREKLGLIDQETIYMKRNVGIAYLSANRVEEAYAAFQTSLSLLEDLLSVSADRGRLRDDLAFNYGSLSFALVEMGKLDEAWNEAMKSTELLKQGHPPVSAIMGK